MHTNLLKSWSIYCFESFKPWWWALYSFILSAGISFCLQVKYEEEVLTFDKSVWIGAVTIFLFTLYSYIADDIQDYKSDSKFFPHRPLPSGRISLPELKYLSYVVSILIFIINLYWRYAIWSLLVLYAYGFLMKNSFYIPHKLQNNRLLAYLVNAPIVFLGSVYLMAIYVLPRGLPLFNSDQFWLAIWWSLPIWAWQITLNIRAPQDERIDYQTFSAMLGHHVAATLPMILLIIHWVVLLRLGAPLRLIPITVVLFIGVVLSTSLFFVHFIFYPNKKRASRLSLIVMMYSLISVGLVLMDFILNKRIWPLLH